MIGILFYDGHDKKARKYAEETHQAVGRENWREEIRIYSKV